MWIFKLSFSNGHSISFPISKDDEATKLFKDLQHWLCLTDRTENKGGPNGVCIKTSCQRNMYVIFRISELISVEIEKMEDKEYNDELPLN